MKPKKSLLQKQETAKRKNRLHWASHKEEIIRRRSSLKAKITTSQLLGQEEGETHGGPVNNEFDNLHIDETLKSTDAQSNNEENSEDHDFDECVSDFDGCCSNISASDQSEAAESGDDERDTLEEMDQEPLCELEKNALEEYLKLMPSRGTDREHDQLVSDDIDWILYFFFLIVCNN